MAERRAEVRPAGGFEAREIIGAEPWTRRSADAYKPPLRLDAPAAQVAQLVEHVTENHGVGGSIPPLGTIIH
jgi:hypothetical protein